MTSDPSRLISEIEERIDEQQATCAFRVKKFPDDIRKYYWDDDDDARNGVAAGSTMAQDVLLQLLVTPKLILDIRPMDSRSFKKMYGITFGQLNILSKRGFIIPHIYIYKDRQYREYAKYPLLCSTLSKFGRPNDEWIRQFLEKKYCFNDHLEKSVTLINKSQIRSNFDIMRQFLRKDIQNFEMFCHVYGQRLAYLSTIGREYSPDIGEHILDGLKQPSQIENTLYLFNTAKELVASHTTASFGGFVHWNTDAQRQIFSSTQTLAHFLPSKGKINILPSKFVPASALEYARDIMERSRYLLEMRRNVRVKSIAEQTQLNFEEYLELLEILKDGKLGRHVENIHNFIDGNNGSTRVSLEELKEEEGILNEYLGKHGGVEKFSDAIGKVTSRFAADQPFAPGEPITDAVNFLFTFIANVPSRIKEVAHDHLTRVMYGHGFKRPYFMVQEWRTLKRELKILDQNE